MKARSAARELALLTLFQLDSDSKGLSGAKTMPQTTNLNQLVLSVVRTLVDVARGQLESAVQDLRSTSEAILDMEKDHPINLNSSIYAAVKPVPIPTTREMVEKIDVCLSSAEYVWEAMRLPEIMVFADTDEVRAYSIHLINLVIEHSEEFDTMLGQASEDWRVERLMKMDRNILRLAIAEMRFVEDVDFSVAINEAVELAKQFSAEDSYKFINGVLGKIAETARKEPKPFFTEQKPVTSLHDISPSRWS